MPAQDDFTAIATAAQAQIDALNATGLTIQASILALQHKDAQGTITTDEQALLARQQAARTAILDSTSSIAQVTLVALDNSAQVSATIASLTQVVSTLQAEQDALQNIANAVQQVATVITSLDGIITKLKSFLPGSVTPVTGS